MSQAKQIWLLFFNKSLLYLKRIALYMKAIKKTNTMAVEMRLQSLRWKLMMRLDIISSFGVINIQVKGPKATTPNKKKRKMAGGTLSNNEVNKKNKDGAVTGHYFNFAVHILNAMDQYGEFKGHYIVMDNAPIHTSKDIQLYIESRGDGCIYLPSYSPKLTPIEQFWSV